MKKLNLVVVGLIAAELALYLSWSHIDDNDPFPGLEQQLGFTAAITVFLLPHVLAWLARYGRPTLLLPAGLIGIVLTLLSSISMLVFFIVPTVLIPSICYLVRWTFNSRRRIASSMVLALFMVPGAIAAAFVLLATQDPRCHAEIARQGSATFVSMSEQQASQPTPSHVSVSCTSDAVALHESGSSLLLSGLILGSGWRHGAPDLFPGDVDHVTGGQHP